WRCVCSLSSNYAPPSTLLDRCNSCCATFVLVGVHGCCRCVLLRPTSPATPQPIFPRSGPRDRPRFRRLRQGENQQQQRPQQQRRRERRRSCRRQDGDGDGCRGGSGAGGARGCPCPLRGARSGRGRGCGDRPLVDGAEDSHRGVLRRRQERRRRGGLLIHLPHGRHARRPGVHLRGGHALHRFVPDRHCPSRGLHEGGRDGREQGYRRPDLQGQRGGGAGRSQVVAGVPAQNQDRDGRAGLPPRQEPIVVVRLPRQRWRENLQEQGRSHRGVGAVRAEGGPERSGRELQQNEGVPGAPWDDLDLMCRPWTQQEAPAGRSSTSRFRQFHYFLLDTLIDLCCG
ncbi:unnamed protein product, partial [Scytosiphon promiscuus]